MRKLKGTAKMLPVALLLAGGIILFISEGKAEQEDYTKTKNASPLWVSYEGIWLRAPRSGNTLGQALQNSSLLLKENDLTIPARDTPLSAVNKVFVHQERTINVRDGNKPQFSYTTYKQTVAQALADAGITLSAADEVTPALETPLHNEAAITITRVTEKTIKERKKIPAPVKVQKDPASRLGAEKVIQPGKAGEEEITLRLKTENGEVAEKTIIAREVIKEAEPRVISRGTKIEVIDTEAGRASWYHAPALTAAHRTLPFGTKLRVVNANTGRSVIVKVADRGPFIQERVIDLSSDAFKKIASLGSGMARVRVEQIR